MNAHHLLKLYICGRTLSAERAISDLRRVCEHELRGQYQVEVIDVLEQPELAERDKVLATPTLIKELPPPIRRVIGDLSDTHKVLIALDLQADAPQPLQRDVPGA